LPLLPIDLPEQAIKGWDTYPDTRVDINSSLGAQIVVWVHTRLSLLDIPSAEFNLLQSN